MTKLKKDPSLAKKRSGFRNIHLERIVVQVDSDSHPGTQWEVSFDRYEEWTCTCPHFKYTKTGCTCKHIIDIMNRFKGGTKK